MTREESIAIIRKEYLCVDRDCDIERSCGKCDLMMPSKEPILEAYKVAIEALEQEEDPYQTDMDEAWNQVKHELESGFYHTEREEAISILSRPFDMSGVPAEILNAHKMAVEALEQEPCGDTISRQAVLDLMRSGISLDTEDDQDYICGLINDMPSVTPTVIEDIKAEIDEQYKWLMQTKYTIYDIDIAFSGIKSAIDKYTSGKENEQ